MNWKKTVDWITFILNMLAALPFLGLISCGICYLAFYIMFPRAMDWLWIPVGILDIILIIFWGKYQYRILVLKVPRSPKETIRNLLLLAVCIAIVVLLILSFVTFWGAERMEKYIKNSYAERKFSHAEMINSRYGIVLPFSIHENDIVKQTNDYIVVKTTSANLDDLREKAKVKQDLNSRWEKLIRQEGCLVSASDMRFSIEGSIFAKNEWKSEIGKFPADIWHALHVGSRHQIHFFPFFL